MVVFYGKTRFWEIQDGQSISDIISLQLKTIWGINVADLEKRRKKLKDLELQ